jgi:hypothetical protein
VAFEKWVCSFFITTPHSLRFCFSSIIFFK